MLTGNLPSAFEELDLNQVTELARFGFDILKAVTSNKSIQERLNSTSCKVSEQMQEIQRILNSCSCKIK